MTNAKNGKPLDLRQRRTRKYLSDALLALMEVRPFSQISVVDICQRAMVHRTTFYSHFDDKQALLRWTVADLMQTEFAKAGANENVKDIRQYFLAVFQQTLDFMKEHQGLFQSADDSETELLLLESTVAEELCSRLTAHKELFPDATLDPEITAHFYAGAILSLVHWWLRTGASVPQEVLLRHLYRFIPLPDSAD